MATDSVGYGTPSDPHGWLWLKQLRDSAPAASSPFASSSALAALVGSAPAALDTLQEIDAQLAADEGSAAALAATVAGKQTAAQVSAAIAAQAAADAATYVPLGAHTPRLGHWLRKLKNDPANAVIAFSGDSTSDSTAAGAFLYTRMGLTVTGGGSTNLTQTAPGEGLYGMTVDTAHIVDGGNNGMPLATYLANYDSNVTTAKSLRWLVAQAPDLIVASWLINDVRLGATTKAQAVALLNRLVAILRAALPNTDLVLRIPATLTSDDYGGSHYVQSSTGTVNPAGAAQAYSDLMRQAYYAVQDTWPNVVLFDMPGLVFGTVAQPRQQMMADQLHPSLTGCFAWVDYLVSNLIGFYPTRSSQPSVSTEPLANSPYTPWTANPAVLDDSTRFALLASGELIAQAAGSYLDFTHTPANAITNYDIVRYPDGQVFQIPSSGFAVYQNGPTCRITHASLPAASPAKGQVRVYRMIRTSSKTVNGILDDSSWRFKRTGRITAGSTTGMTVRAYSLTAARATQPASEWVQVMAAGDVVTVVGDDTNPRTLTAGQFVASGSNLVLSGLTAGTDYSALIGKFVVITGTHTDAVPGPTGPAGSASGFGAPAVTGSYSNPMVFGSTAGATLGASVGNAIPMVWAANTTIDRLAVDVTTAVASSTVALALYDSDPTTVQPKNLLGDFGTIDSSTTGFKETASIASPPAVTAGKVYWAVARSGATPGTIRVFSNSGGLNPFVTPPAASSGSAGGYLMSMPSSFPSTWSGATITSNPPVIRARCL